MSDFVPMQFVPLGPAGDDGYAAPAAPVVAPREFQVVVPVSRTVRLDEVSGPVAPVPGTVYQRDYFLLHPIDGAVQRVWFASSLPTAQTNFRVQLIGEDGEELTPRIAYARLPIVSTLLTERVGASAGGPVYLRVQAESQAADLFVTVELLVGEALQ
jgi:hypothetical protein